MNARTRWTASCLLAILALLAVCGSPGTADARIVRIQVTATESPTFGGYSWPGVGQYEKVVGKAFGEVDPFDTKNAVIVDIQLAPRNAGGKVEYSFDFYILKPIDLSRGAHKVMYEPPNRGGKTWGNFGRMPGGNDPGSVTDPTVLANAFLMPRGYTMVWSGWDKAAGTSTAGFNTTITLPIAKNADGSSITGPAYEYIVMSGTAAFPLNYPAATLDKSKATLTHRVHLNDVPAVIPATGWTYNASGTTINLVPAGWVANDIYEFSYTANDPSVNGLGFAAIRDWNAWLRYEAADDFGTPNPLKGDIQRIYTEVVSQPGRTERNRQDHLYAEGVFPFANVKTHDPITGKTDSRYARCKETGTCPYGVEIYSANEYWVKAASLLHTNSQGTRDLHESRFTRNYLISSHQHGTGNSASKGNCRQFLNPLNSAPVQRALFVALDEWATEHTKPPRSRVPRLHDKTLVPPLPQAGMGFPSIPGVTYTGLKTTRYLLDYGPHYDDTGIATVNPPLITPPYEDNPHNGPIYPSFIPKTDRDGNDIAGVRLVDVTVPIATYTGWALRAGPQANDGCESAGQFVPFPKTKADRLASGDPRQMVEDRLMLCEDTASEYARLIALGLAQGVPAPPGPPPAVSPVPLCGDKNEHHGDDRDDERDDD